MDSSAGYGPPQVPEPTQGRFTQFHHPNSIHHHHHHHFQVSPHCPFHSFMLHPKSHSPNCPFLASSYPQSQTPETLASVPSSINPFDLQVSQPKETIFNSSLLAMHEEKNVEMEEEGEHREEEEEEEEEDPVFVLTDEWREFFAKSEAKRRLAKKQARRKGKNRTEQ